jgi:hypothetical protein
VLQNLQSKTWNQAWAARLPNCNASFEEVKAFLELGEDQQRQQRAEDEDRVKQKLADAEALAQCHIVFGEEP